MANHGRRAQELLDIVDAAKHGVVISDHVVRPEKAVQLDGVESVGTDVGGHAVDDEVNVTVKLLNLRIVAILAAVFDRQRMKMKDVEEHLFISLCR